MYYPKLNEIPNTREQIDVFKGYNHNLRIKEGEFFDMKNLSSDHYPVLSPRKQRGVYRTTSKASGMSSNTNFCYVDGRYLYIGDERVDLSLTQGMKDIVGFGSNVVIFPDQKYVNTVNIADRGHAKQGVFDLPAQAQDSTELPKVVFTLVHYDEDSSTYTTLINKSRGNVVWVGGAQVSVEEAKERGDYLFRSVTTKASGWEVYTPQKRYNSDAVLWYPYDYAGSYPAIGVYVLGDDEENTKIILNSIASAITETPIAKITGTTTAIDSLPGAKVKVGEGIICDRESGDEEVLRRGLVIYQTSQLTMDPSVLHMDAGYLVRDGQASVGTWSPLVLDTPISITAPYNTNSATIPAMDFVIEAGNRLWGCRYEYNNNGEWVNEIYASELGNFKNWNKLEGTSTDSYVASVGTSGAFTGAINYGGYPIFFKEDCIHKVYGNYPANFQIQTINCKGVQKGCSKSLAIVNGILYYKSRSAICAYDGSSPIEISPQMADVQYETAVGGALGNKYYVSMKKVGLEDFDLFVFDSLKGMWHKEDDTDAAQFCNHEGELYFIDRADGFIHTINGKGVKETRPIQWYAETGIIGATTPDNKYMSRIDIRMAIAKQSKVSLHIEYDSMGIWERLTEVEGLTLTTVTIPVKPRRCDHFRLKIEGEGDAKIFAITKTMEVSG